MTLTASELWVMATAAACAGACALCGCFLVLRRMSMLGDAISHAVLPGLAGAFLLTGTRDPLVMLLGAGAVGLLTTVLTAAIQRFGKVHEDAAMGVVFSSMFALGVLLISRAADKVDLDPSCVLYGMIETVSIDRVGLLGVELPRAFVVLGVAFGVNVVLVTVFFKELRLVCFDSALATSMGFAAGAVHYGLMALVAGTSVAAFEAVGSILVVAMLVGPGATAFLLTQRLGRMLWIAVAVGVACAAVGTVAAVWLDTSYAGAISVALGGAFALALVFSPREGLVVQQVRRLRLALKVRREDILGTLVRMAESGEREREHAGRLAVLNRGLGRVAAWQLVRRGLVAGGALTGAGEAEGRRVLAAHRLWETFLATEVGLPVDHVHDPSERFEHFVSGEMERELRVLHAAGVDPQGRPIPGGGGGGVG
ncbi:MAG TPA: metal ABC transporter permease [Phycisphaerales bacterium]|nr:metal ABC transporter permease [Phycisphaerales bacterium]